MIPQGSQLVNLAYFESLKKQAGGIASCQDLQAYADEVVGSVNAAIAGINSQLALIKPVLDLLIKPDVNPQAIVTWLENFILSYLTPYIRPYAVYAAEAAAIAMAVAELEQTLQSLATKFPSCGVSLPSLTPVQVP